MKVALVHIRHSWTGGTERHLTQLAGFLAERGHEVTVVCRSVKGESDPRVRFEVLTGLAIGGGWRAWAFAKAVERHVENAEYDVVYALGRTWTHDAIRLGGGCHATYLELAHEATLSPLDRVSGKGRLKQALTLRIEARALAPGAYRRVVTNSRMVERDVVARYGVPPDEVSVIYNGVDTARFDPVRNAVAGAALRRELGFEDGDFVVLFLGTGYGRKGLERLLRAFPTIAASCPTARLVVAGFDSDEARFRRRAEDLGVGARTRFLGGRSDTEACYAAADLYALPTLYDPFANTTLEALASGLPVVTTDTNGGAELIAPGVHGSVLAAGSGAGELAEAIRTWSNSERRVEARTAARSLALDYPALRTARESAEMLEALRSQPEVVTSFRPNTPRTDGPG